MRQLKHRRSSLLAIVVAIAMGAALATACATLLQTAFALDTTARELGGADLVVTPAEHAVLAGADGTSASRVTLPERAALPAGLTAEIAAVDGVAHAAPRPELDAVAVSARAGVDRGELKSRLERRLDDRHLSVLAGSDRGRAEATGVAASRLKLILLSGIFGGMALIVMAILLQSIIGLSIEQRRRELALLRTIGATPRQVRRLVVGQTMRPAWAAAAAGALAGPLFARALFSRIRDGGVVPDVLVLREGVLPLVAGALAVLVVTRISAGIGARRVGSARIGEAVAEVEDQPAAIGLVRRSLALVAVAIAASSAVMTMFMPAANAAAVGGSVALAGAVACALVAPLLAERLAARLSGAAYRVGGVPGELAALNVRGRARRTGALVVPVILVVSIALANIYQQTTQAHAMRSAYLDGLRADAVVTSSSGAIPPGAVAAARSVGPTSASTSSTGWIERPVDPSHRVDPWTLVGVEPSGLASEVVDGSLRGFDGDAVALPKDVAGDLDVEPGDSIGMVLGDGAHVRLRVAALLGGSKRYPSIVLPPSLLAAHTTSGLPEQLLVNGGTELRARLARALAGYPQLQVRGGAALAEDFDDGLQVDQWITFAVVGVILAYAAMALVNVLVAALGGRRRELTLLRLAGASTRQIRQMLQIEALLVAAIGAIAGTAVAIGGLIPLAIAQAGSPLPSGPVWILPAVLATAAALVLLPTLAMSHTTLRNLKVNDVEAL